MDTVGISSIAIINSNGRVIHLQVVRHVPSLISNLLLVGELIDDRVVVTFFQDDRKLTIGALVLTQGHSIGTFYKLDVTTHVKNECNVLFIGKRYVENCFLWHTRLRHLNEASLRQMHSVGNHNLQQ